MSKARIDDIETAVIAYIALDTLMNGVQVEGISANNADFAAERLIVTPPAVLVHYAGGNPQAGTADWHLYSVEERFTLYIVASALRDSASARQGVATERGAYQMIEDLRTIFAGRQLFLQSGGGPAWCRFAESRFLEFDEQGNAIYALDVIVKGIWEGV